MTILRPESLSITPADYEAFRHSDRLISSRSRPTAATLSEVTVDGHRMALRSLIEGGATRYRVRVENPCVTEGPVTTCSEAASRTMEMSVALAAGVSIEELSEGDYDGDGDNDIVLRLSDGTCRVLMAVEAEAGAAATPPPDGPPSGPAPGSNNVQRPRENASLPEAPPPPSVGPDGEQLEVAPDGEVPGPEGPAEGSGETADGAEGGGDDYEHSHDYLDGI